MTGTFRLDVIPGLFDRGNRALVDAWRPARRLVVVRDGHAGERGRLLAAYLRDARECGLLDDFLVVDAEPDSSAGLSSCDAVVESAIRAKLGRRDAFVTFAGERTSQVVAATAASFRRHTHSMRIHKDLSATMTAVRDGMRAALPDDPVSALQRDTMVLVDEDGLLADQRSDRAECWVLLTLGLLDRQLLDRISGVSATERRAEGLSAIVRLCRRFGPGHAAWRLAETWLTAVPAEIDPNRRRGWSVLLAAQVAHRLGMLPDDLLCDVGRLARRLDPGLPAIVPLEAARLWAAQYQVPGDELTVPLPTGADDGAQLVTVDRAVLDEALTYGASASARTVNSAGAETVTSTPRRPGLPSAMAIRVELRTAPSASYPVRFLDLVLEPESKALDDVLPQACKVLAVVDPYRPDQLRRVHRLLASYRGSGTVSQYTVLPATATDRAKTLDQVSRVLRAAEQLSLGAGDRLIVVGGGTVMDIVGYAAYLYEGDTPYIRIPTTLVGMIDAGIGLKVGVNVDVHKNLLGAYHPPLVCVCDMGFLRTLSRVERRCGIAEAIKIGAVCDRSLFELIEQKYDEVLSGMDTAEVRTILVRSIHAMLRQLEANPFEDNTRRLPDFGHEFGHMLESLSRYRLRHGEAVAIGMALSCCLASYLGYLPRTELHRILSLLRRVGFTLYDPVCDPSVLWRKLHDEVLSHKGGHLYLVVPRRIGTGEFIDSIDDLSPAMLADACDELRTGRLGRPEGTGR